jgi:RNA polymerase sigma-70 factor (ECF subfamily)
LVSLQNFKTCCYIKLSVTFFSPYFSAPISRGVLTLSFNLVRISVMISDPSTNGSAGTESEVSARREKRRVQAQDNAYDVKLVDRFKAGDRAALDEIVSRHWDKIYSVVVVLLRNRQDAEEVTQDTFIRANRGLVNFRGDSALGSWLYGIALNLARNRYWYWWRRKRHESISIDAPIGDEGSGTFADVIPAEVESPDEIAVTAEFVSRVARGMEYLSAKHREILVLRNVKELSYEEIAAVLEINVGTVKSRIGRAREELRKKIEEASGGEQKVGTHKKR